MAKEFKALPSRRDLLIGGIGVVTASLLLGTAAATAAEPKDMSVQRTDTAVVFNLCGDGLQSLHSAALPVHRIESCDD
jgi:hypothetical protein